MAESKRGAPRRYRVMEYLDPGASAVIGWALIPEAEHRKWAQGPRAWDRRVTGYYVIDGMESMAEHGTMPRARLWDYYHTVDALPRKPFSAASLEAMFEMAPDHPALRPGEGEEGDY